MAVNFMAFVLFLGCVAGMVVCAFWYYFFSILVLALITVVLYKVDQLLLDFGLRQVVIEAGEDPDFFGSRHIQIEDLHFSPLRAVVEMTNFSLQNDEDVRLNLDFEVGFWQCSLVTGRCEVKDLVVKNPPGYNSPYLLKAKRMYVNLGMSATVCSGMKRLVLDEVTLDDVDAMVEYDGPLSSTSNLHKVVGMLNRKQEDSPSTSRSKKTNPLSRRLRMKAKEMTTELRKVQLKNVGFMFYVTGTRVAMSNMYYDNFSSQFAEADDAVSQVIWEVLQTLSKSILATVAGKTAAEQMM